MRIPNKFNGYMADGRRLYNDPVTSTIMADALVGTAGTAAAATVPVGAELATTAVLPGIVGGAAPELSAAATNAAAPTLGAQAMSPEIAANMAQNGIMQGAGDQAAMNLNQVNALGSTAAPPASPDVINGPKIDPFTQATPAPQAAPTAAPAPTGAPQPFQNVTSPDYAKDMRGIYGPSPASTNVMGEVVEPMANYGGSYAPQTPLNPFERGMKAATDMADKVGDFATKHPYLTTAGIYAAQGLMAPSSSSGGAPAKKTYSRGSSNFEASSPSTVAYNPIYKPTQYAANGGIMGYAVGGPIEQMSAQNAVGDNTMYPQSQLQTAMYSNPMVQRPMPENVINQGTDMNVDPYSGQEKLASGGTAFDKLMREQEKQRQEQMDEAHAFTEKIKNSTPKTIPYSRTQQTNSPYAAAVKELQAMGKKQGIKIEQPPKTSVDVMGDQDQVEYAAKGGIMYGLGGYSDGGRLLKGPGDGVSDSIPAVIGHKQPARLADGEFVVPARIVSELGNGSTEAGARKLYAMMERVQKQRGKTVGKGKVAVNSKADKHLPA
jgi:hypothetical protein